MTKTWAVLTVLVLVLAGCSDPEPPAYWSQTTDPVGVVPSAAASATAEAQASERCEASMIAASEEMRLTAGAEDIELRRTVSACTSVEEWVDALERHPGAFGMTEQHQVDPALDLAGLCDQSSALVCADARSKGLNTFWQ